MGFEHPKFQMKTWQGRNAEVPFKFKFPMFDVKTNVAYHLKKYWAIHSVIMNMEVEKTFVAHSTFDTSFLFSFLIH